jgi:Trk K+ transport system NAD-binding subunit
LQEENDVTLVDSNREMVELAKEEGLDAVFGNILKEETMEQAKAIDKGTFIAITANSEINLLAAQLANDSFYIPKKIVLVDPKESGAGVDLLDRIDASSMFATKTLLEPWTYKLTTGNAREQEILIEEEMSTRQWVKEQKKKQKDFLPILIVNPEGHKRPFHFHDTISPGEKIIYLQ